MYDVIKAVAGGIEAFAVLIIVIGIVYGFIRLLVARTAQAAGIYQGLKRRIGNALLLGLEFLVAADIIRTVALEPTFVNVAELGVLVVIRTFLSWALIVETEGKWPWQTSAESERRE